MEALTRLSKKWNPYWQSNSPPQSSRGQKKGTGILVLGFLVFPPILFVAPALICYINSRFLLKVFDRYMPQICLKQPGSL